MSSSIWTLERTRRLISLWNEGLTAAAIAARLGDGISRCAVLGKAHRLGLARARPSRPARRTKSGPGATSARSARCAPQERASGLVRTRPPASTSGPASSGTPAHPATTILSVRRGECRWPYGAPATAGFGLCGGPVERGAYCAAHAAVGYLARPISAEGLIRMAESGSLSDRDADDRFVC